MTQPMPRPPGACFWDRATTMFLVQAELAAPVLRFVHAHTSSTLPPSEAPAAVRGGLCVAQVSAARLHSHLMLPAARR